MGSCGLPTRWNATECTEPNPPMRQRCFRCVPHLHVVLTRGAIPSIDGEGMTRLTTITSTPDVPGRLTCGLAPLAGLEPAPYGLEVRLAPSGWCRPEASPQVAPDLPSAWSHPGRHRDNDRIANRIASLTTGRANQSATTGYQELPSSPCREQAAYAEDHQLHPKAT